MSELPATGAQAPGFMLKDRDGTSLTFGEGEPAAPTTLLFFFKHDCATCDLMAPLVERLHGALAGDGLRVVGVSQDSPTDTTGFVNRHALSFRVALDAELEVSADYGFDAVPALVLVDPTRQVGFSFE
ncbi:MAG: TlpA disulfide reductase family protein, partial [Vicinamibacterales bacterium]|nr:TlpA disulfide reductase family protein [Vicinamibacterales bacterium]